MKKPLLLALCGLLAITLTSCHSSSVPSDNSGAKAFTSQGLELAGIKVTKAQISSITSDLQIPGQVSPTEAGKADINSPLNGVIMQPLLKVGQRVAQGEPVAVVNSVYGQTGLQIAKALEGDRNGVVSAQATLTSAQGNLGGAESTLSQARTALGAARISYNQAIDTLDQARAELIAARKDLKRKRELFTGGVFAKSDVDDAQERYDKAVSAWRDADRSLKDAKQNVDLAQQNVTIDDSNIASFRHNVDASREALDLAQANLERDRAIYAQPDLAGSSLPQHLTPVRLNPDGTYSENAAADATAFLVRAPFSGIITNVAMTRGMAVTPGTVLATVVDTRRVYVDGSAFETDLADIHLGDKMQATSAAFPNDKFIGHVQVIGKLVDATSRTVTVRCLVDNPQDRLKPGMFVVTALYPSQPRRAIVLPETAVLVHGDKHFVFVQNGQDQYDKREVTIGATENGMTEVVNGVKAGDTVVTQGNLLLESQE